MSHSSAWGGAQKGMKEDLHMPIGASELLFIGCRSGGNHRRQDG